MSYVVEKIKQYFDEKGVRYEHFEKSEKRDEALRIVYGGDNADAIKIILFFDEDGGSLNVKSFTIAKVPTAKLMETYVVLNELNNEYRWVKFYVDSDNEVTAAGDAIIDDATAGEECYEIVQRYVNIIDAVYPRIMKVIWA